MEIGIVLTILGLLTLPTRSFMSIMLLVAGITLIHPILMIVVTIWALWKS